MKKQAVHREYNIPDADLYIQCIDRLRMAKRDIEQFKTYGYGIERVNQFIKMCDNFSKLPSDDELVGNQMLSTEKKYTSAEAVKTAIRSVMTRVNMKYSNRSGRYRKFGTAKMGDMTDAQLLFCGRRVVRVARQQAEFLADSGLREEHLHRVIEACKQFEQALNIQQDKVSDRDIAVENRIEQGNKLYRELVTLCNIGKDIWAESNKSKYEGYVLYESNADQKRARKAKEKADK
ncbi:MAG: hypothetical protein AAFV80_17730 [Bacteroidota bacterium]